LFVTNDTVANFLFMNQAEESSPRMHGIGCCFGATGKAIGMGRFGRFQSRRLAGFVRRHIDRENLQFIKTGATALR